MHLRAHIWRLIYPQSGRLSWFNWLILFLIAASLVLLSIETERTLPLDVRRFCARANLVILYIFALEYAARLWAAGEEAHWRGASGRVRYATQPALIADLVAFAPELVVIALFPQLAEQAMFLRALRLIRILRFLSLIPVLRRMKRAIASVTPQLLAGLGIALMTIFVAACALYFAESRAQPEQFGSIPRAVWWAVVTLTTVGYGDVYPVTVPGRIAAAIAAIAGVGVVALPAGIVAGAFSQEFARHDPPRPSKEE